MVPDGRNIGLIIVLERGGREHLTLSMHPIEIESDKVHLVIGLMVEHERACTAWSKQTPRLAPNTAHQL